MWAAGRLCAELAILASCASCGRFGFAAHAGGDDTAADAPPAADAACLTVAFADSDGDGWGSAQLVIPAGTCAPVGAAAVGGDCDDSDPAVNPGALDTCTTDRNCNGALDVHVPDGCATVQAVLDAAGSSHTPATVLLGSGVHVEDITFGGAAVMITGAGAGMTTLRGTGTRPVATFVDGEGSASGLRDLTITGGVCIPDAMLPNACFGGGVAIDNASPTLASLEITGNAATVTSGGGGFGGGLSMRKSAATLTDLDIHDNNSDYYAGGIYVDQSNGITLTRLRLRHNRSTAYGGGIVVEQSTAVHVDTLLLAGNQADSGAGIFVQDAAATFTNVTAFGNTCTDGCGLYTVETSTVTVDSSTFSGGQANPSGGALNGDGTGTLTVTYTDFFGNGATPFGSLSAPVGSGDLAVDPLLVNTSGTDTSAWDLHLAAGSPLRHAGDPLAKNTDGSRSDIGAYGGSNAF